MRYWYAFVSIKEEISSSLWINRFLYYPNSYKAWSIYYVVWVSSSTARILSSSVKSKCMIFSGLWEVICFTMISYSLLILNSNALIFFFNSLIYSSNKFSFWESSWMIAEFKHWSSLPSIYFLYFSFLISLCLSSCISF